jgi:hypothetical protein
MNFVEVVVALKKDEEYLIYVVEQVGLVDDLQL